MRSTQNTEISNSHSTEHFCHIYTLKDQKSKKMCDISYKIKEKHLKNAEYGINLPCKMFVRL